MNSIRKLDGPVIESTDKTKYLLIFLHGWGSDGNDLIQIANVWKNELHQITFFAPNGPEVCSGNPNGKQWFDIMTEDKSLMLSGLNKAYLDLKEFIDVKVKEYQVQPNNCFLVGFSQGTMLALYAGVREKLLGIVGYSGAFLGEITNPLKFRNDFLLIHGREDKVVPLERMNNAYEILKNLANFIDTKIYDDLEHSINNQGLQEGYTFIKNRAKLSSKL